MSACLRAAVEGPFFPDWEFSTLFGLEREEVRAVADAWPTAVDSDETALLAIHNTLANLAGYPHGEEAELFQRTGLDHTGLQSLLERWRAVTDEGRRAAGVGQTTRQPSLPAYIAAYYSELMTDQERQACWAAQLRQKATHSSPAVAEELLRRVSDAGESEIGPIELEALWAAIADRILRDHGDRLIINRCPRCAALCRTPRSRQCAVCHHRWHSG